MEKELRKIWFVPRIRGGLLNYPTRVCSCLKYLFTINRTSQNSARYAKVHLYWCMRNCGGNPDHLRAMIINNSEHFQVCVCV